jgi:hypothetical protein
MGEGGFEGGVVNLPNYPGGVPQEPKEVGDKECPSHCMLVDGIHNECNCNQPINNKTIENKSINNALNKVS